MKPLNAKLVELVGQMFDARSCKLMRESRLVEDMGLNNLDRVELWGAVEEDFGISISDDDENRMVTLGDLSDLVDESITPPPSREL